MRLSSLIVAVATLAAPPALAQSVTLPDENVPEDDRESFRLCRAAVLVELNAPEGARADLPPGYAEAMQEQFTFIMADTLFSLPALDFEDGARRLRFAERFVLEFGRTVGADSDRLSDPEERARILPACQPMLWAATKERLETLIEWRRRAMQIDKPSLPAVDPPPRPAGEQSLPK